MDWQRKIWGGANNVAKNESDNCLTYALLTTSCINNEVMVYNKKLHKKMKLFDYER
jgi:hypothetical protein